MSDPTSTHEGSVSPKKERVFKWLVPTIGYAIAIASLIWVFHAFDYKQLGRDVRALHWGWVALAIVLNLLVFVVDAWRWAILLRPAEEAPLDECTKAVFVGIVANGVLPAKAGEIVRCYLLSYWTDTPLSLALTADAIGRVMDGICIVVGFYLLTIGMEIPRYLRDGALAMGIGVLVLALLFAYILFRREHASTLVSKNKWAARFAHLMHEIHSLGNAKTLLAALALSVLYLFLPVLSLWALFLSFGFDFSLAQAGVALIIVHLGTALPNAPANIGSFQFFATVALELLKAGKTDAKIFSVIFYFAHTLPQILVGVAVLFLTGLKLGEVHMHARRAEEERRIPAPVSEK